MTASEFMAMLDCRLSDGRNYPTLDDYSAALAMLPKREREAAARQGGRGEGSPGASESRAGLPGPAQVAPPKPTVSYEPVQPLFRVSSRQPWFRVDVAGGDGNWYPVQGTESQSDEYLRTIVLPRLQRAQGHVTFHIVQFYK